MTYYSNKQKIYALMFSTCFVWFYLLRWIANRTPNPITFKCLERHFRDPIRSYCYSIWLYVDLESRSCEWMCLMLFLKTSCTYEMFYKGVWKLVGCSDLWYWQCCDVLVTRTNWACCVKMCATGQERILWIIRRE